MSALDFEQLSRELLVALRGRRSQVQWSRRLGYRSNVAYAWESGRRAPTAAETFRAVRRSGVPLKEALTRFYGRAPPWFESLDCASPEGVSRLLEDLRGTTTVTDLARRAKLSRWSVSRWLSARTQPRLPDFLRLVEAASLRSVDLLACLADPTKMPTVAPIWERLEANRRGAFELPWTQAVLRALELEDYRALPEHLEGWLSGRLGISFEQEQRCMEFLIGTHRVLFDGSHYAPEDLAVDTRRHPEIGRRLKAHWTSVAAERVVAGGSGQFSYNVFTVSRADFERIREMHLRYFHALRAVVGESQPGEVVAVANVQLFPLEPLDAR